MSTGAMNSLPVILALEVPPDVALKVSLQSQVRWGRSVLEVSLQNSQVHGGHSVQMVFPQKGQVRWRPAP